MNWQPKAGWRQSHKYRHTQASRSIRRLFAPGNESAEEWKVQIPIGITNSLTIVWNLNTRRRQDKPRTADGLMNIQEMCNITNIVSSHYVAKKHAVCLHSWIRTFLKLRTLGKYKANFAVYLLPDISEWQHISHWQEQADENRTSLLFWVLSFQTKCRCMWLYINSGIVVETIWVGSIRHLCIA